MTLITVRPAHEADTDQMASLLNKIIAIGGTTAFLNPVTPQTIAMWMSKDSTLSSWFVALNQEQQILGYQSSEVSGAPAPDALNMASFVSVDHTGLGIGSRLFKATCAAARARGFRWLNASIRSDNDSGLRYYSKMGFVTYRIDTDAKLSDGRQTGKTHKRFDL